MAGSARDLAWPDLDLVPLQPLPLRRASTSGWRPPSKAGFAGIGLYAPEYQRLRRRGRTLGRGHPHAGSRTTAWCVAEIEALKGWSSPPGPEADASRKMEDARLRDGRRVRLPLLPGRRPGRGHPASRRRRLSPPCATGPRRTVCWWASSSCPSPASRMRPTPRRLIDAADRPNAGCCVDIWHHTRGAADEAADPGADRGSDHGRADERRPAHPDDRRLLHRLPGLPGAAGRGRVRLHRLRSPPHRHRGAGADLDRGLLDRAVGRYRPTRPRAVRPTGCAPCWPRRPPARDQAG